MDRELPAADDDGATPWWRSVVVVAAASLLGGALVFAVQAAVWPGLRHVGWFALDVAVGTVVLVCAQVLPRDAPRSYLARGMAAACDLLEHGGRGAGWPAFPEG